ncbi:hypothetical protein ILUMI_13481 [Ignelater luminosus]|uniref:PiggyBac transposable element-derived protein domain-containing protein n=1 Tax=Ignelater luminosus TaxID=2038154 RepID=A0A8K0CWN9_IGNLU|nr:hypothetical protein ILUMI_13481 [Ignelater luminosus]
MESFILSVVGGSCFRNLEASLQLRVNTMMEYGKLQSQYLPTSLKETAKNLSRTFNVAVKPGLYHATQYVLIHRDITLEEALAIIEEDDSQDIRCIYTEHPEQLRAEVEVVVSASSEKMDNPEPVTEVDLETTLANDKSSSAKKRKVNKLKDFTWIKKDIFVTKAPFPEADYKRYRDKTPYGLFQLFFSDDVVEFLLSETIKYSHFTNCGDPLISKEHIWIFSAILILSGYNTAPTKRDYWDSKGDLRNELVYNVMRKNKFVTISLFLYCADNCYPDPVDKMWKLRPLMSKI